MSEQEEHIKKFLNSSTYDQLSANQQKHAQEILTRFNKYMTEEHRLDDTAWTPQAVKEVMVGQFIADPALTNSFGIAVAPVLKAYQKFLGNDQLNALEVAIDDQRPTMNKCRKAHQTLAAMTGEPEKKASVVKKTVTQTTREEVQQSIAPVKLIPADKMKQEISRIKKEVATAPEFKGKDLSTTDQQYLVVEFLQLMYQECHQGPNQWRFNDLQLVLGMMMPLDPNITKLEILNIVPTAQALFDYLKRTDQIDMEQYRVALKSIAHMQTSQNMLASMERRQRTTQLMLSYIQSQGVNIDDVKKTEKWMDTHQLEVATFMRSILNPWGEYERQQLQKRQQASQQQVPVEKDHQLLRKKKVPQGIKFSKKRRKRRKK
ncbi:hypothetical protein [Limosilactobacillus fastidiosus]|uniref:Uncharacterized protein n=1 Tax=Limosilactobacillus fastidiosus TaxID=2759855 RepID=A0A7W3YBK2_9LACO|nr:hypothetical protein [Limosilactobacillus fastidiosus]MBB1062671.1 hypothetical protein [Limosilactobacillus fastidiosus]MBB1085769.1 hypothetical protein [Limosilactobacillus fastidiosus]MCD7083959.1 hypothetical protein [Limosilactobacillus fastidiosus]MCD7085894.1 hypothetical protein [Limosilactobacillus fastidiosus]MCD7113971.1 hypothetical protein [Limosilactobacillus fastidiosus]